MPRYSSSRAIVKAHLISPNCMECKVPNIMDVIKVLYIYVYNNNRIHHQSITILLLMVYFM